MAENDSAPDDLRSILSQSFDQAATAAAEPVVVETTKAAPEAAATEPEAKTAERARDEGGKFAKKADGDDKTASKADDKEKPEADKLAAKSDKPDAETDKTKAADDKSVEPKPDAKDPSGIARWSASDKAMFKLQSPEAQEFLLRRHNALESEFTKKLAPLADLKKEYEPVQQLFAPHLDVLKQKGLTPGGVIQRWADVETKLANGHGIAIIDGLIKGYGIDKAQLAKALGFTSSPAATQGTETATADPAAPVRPAAVSIADIPELRALSEKVAKWETDQQQAKISAAKAAEDKIEADILKFKSETDDKGELKRPYFDEVEPAMVALAQSYATRGIALPTFETLYDEAVWANPSTRQALLAAQKAAQEAKAAEEARAKSRQAQRAASSVTGAPGSGQATRPVRSELSLRDTIGEAVADLG